MESADGQRSRAHAYSSSDPPAITARDPYSLRRYNSSNPDVSVDKKVVQLKPYESEYDKLSRYLQSSGNISRSRSQKHDDDKELRYSVEGCRRARPRAQTEFPSSINEDLYMAPNEIASLPNSRRIPVSRAKTSPLSASMSSDALLRQSQDGSSFQTLKTSQALESAIYGVAQGKGPNLVMELKDLQTAASKFYNLLLNTSINDPRMADLRTYLRSGDNSPVNDILSQIYKTLQPPVPCRTLDIEDNTEYVMNFHQDCRDKVALKERLMLLYAKPGPPSVTFQKITSKLDAVLDAFAEMVVKLRTGRNETVVSPFHAQNILRSITSGPEGESLVNSLLNNELWIRWGTETGLPPMPHLYMLKHSPAYEMRKAVVLSMLAERKEKISTILSTYIRLEALIPPIYGKLDDDANAWQVTEFDSESGKMETHSTKLPQWIEESHKLTSHLKSTNRTPFKFGDHIHCLYSVYLVIIKDITLSEGSFAKESRAPSSHQIYVGSSTTGVLYKFLGVANNHCENTMRALEAAQTLSNFRCLENISLVDAYLALSWIRHQPRAVFVINSFHEGDMVNLSLNKKKPFYDKMITLEQHYINSKKLGPTSDMRYGMNQLGEKDSPLF